MCLAFVGADHLYRRLIRKEHTLLQDFLMQRVDQRL